MNDREEQMGEVIVTMNSKKQVQGITTIAPEVIRKFPANAGIENILKTLQYVILITYTYAVRGGNYDENLVYVNEIEIYRPFLIRSDNKKG
jgi:hypothetical protein